MRHDLEIAIPLETYRFFEGSPGSAIVRGHGLGNRLEPPLKLIGFFEGSLMGCWLGSAIIRGHDLGNRLGL